jgi:hypothetical protein
MIIVRHRAIRLAARFLFERHSDYIETDLDSVGQEGFTTMFAVGLINPMGPTMNALVANGFGSLGERRADSIFFPTR